MKVKNQKCPTCNQVFRFNKRTKLMAWCPKCFWQARLANVRFISKPLIELKESI